MLHGTMVHGAIGTWVQCYMGTWVPRPQECTDSARLLALSTVLPVILTVHPWCHHISMATSSHRLTQCQITEPFIHQIVISATGEVHCQGLVLQGEAEKKRGWLSGHRPKRHLGILPSWMQGQWLPVMSAHGPNSHHQNPPNFLPFKYGHLIPPLHSMPNH